MTAAYWAFTLSDGALRTVALLFFHAIGYGPLTLAFLFLLYELAGIIANTLGGWLAGQRGLKFTLLTGLFLQIVALCGLSLVNQEQVVDVDRGLSDDCSKVVPEVLPRTLPKCPRSRRLKPCCPIASKALLFKWVAVLTGSKNALKGVGFFLGGALLTLLGYISTLFLMAGLLAVVWFICAVLLPKSMGKAKKKKKLITMFARSRAINILSARALIYLPHAMSGLLSDYRFFGCRFVVGFLANWRLYGCLDHWLWYCSSIYPRLAQKH